MKSWQGALWAVFSGVGLVISIFAFVRESRWGSTDLIIGGAYFIPFIYFALGIICGYRLSRTGRFGLKIGVIILAVLMFLYSAFFVFIVRKEWGDECFTLACFALSISIISILAVKAKVRGG